MLTCLIIGATQRKPPLLRQLPSGRLQTECQNEGLETELPSHSQVSLRLLSGVRMDLSHAPAPGSAQDLAPDVRRRSSAGPVFDVAMGRAEIQIV